VLDRSERARQVLVVDDEPALRAVLVGALEDEGYTVRSAANGKLALDLLGRWQPDLILLDLMMPELDGWDLRARLLANESWSHIPVVVLSAAPDRRGGVERLRAAAVFPKPFELDSLLDTVAALL
jgi:CheY-like chemotaxis protein